VGKLWFPTENHLEIVAKLLTFTAWVDMDPPIQMMDFFLGGFLDPPIYLEVQMGELLGYSKLFVRICLRYIIT
jgi:hypothetical protein